MSGTESLVRFAREAGSDDCAFDGADVSPRLFESDAAFDDVRDPVTSGLGLRGRNLTNASLRNANLSQCNLDGATLDDAVCSGADLSGAHLEGASLIGTDLVGAKLQRVNAGEADMTRALLEDAVLDGAQLRFANFTDAILDGANLTGADMWGARFGNAEADRVLFREARLDESTFSHATLTAADFSGCTLRRADFSGAAMQNTVLRDAAVEGANFAEADLSGAMLANVSLATCTLTHARFAGAWLERTRMRARQLGGAVGEEMRGDLQGAMDSYLVLERNFLSLGISDDAGWAYLRRRRVERRLHGIAAATAWRQRQPRPALSEGLRWLGDSLAQWLCDYGQSLYRTARAFAVILIFFAVVYWLTGSLRAREGFSGMRVWDPVNYLLFSLNSMTTVGTSEVALRPRNELGILLSSLQTVLGTVLLGLFGFVLGARIRG